MAAPTIPPPDGRSAHQSGSRGETATGSRRGRLRHGLGLVGPRRDRHVLPADQPTAFCFPVGDDGVVIGVDALGQPAVLGLFRPSPFDVVLVGGMWAGQVLSLRAAATGARVAVETGRGQAWQPLAQAAGGGMPCVTVHGVGRVAPQGPSVSSPVLVVRDCGARPPRTHLPAAPWQSVVTLLPYLGPTAARLLGHADLVGVQRVSPEEAEVIGQVMGLPAQDVASLSSLEDNATLWCTRRHRSRVTTTPTDAETGLLGSPRRVD